MGSLTNGEFVAAEDLNPITADTGDVKWSALRLPPSGWLNCDGSAVSRTDYANLFAAIVPSLGACTVTLASPGVFTLASHGLVIGDRVYLTTTGALPTGLSANTIYYVVSTPTSSTFTLSATEGGTAINTSGSQSGTHTLYYCPYGLGDGSTTFNVPDAGGRAPVVASGSSGDSNVRALGQNDGVAVGNRRGLKHQHTPHHHIWSGSGASWADDQGYAYWGDPSGQYRGTQATSDSDGGSGVATDPVDGGAFITLRLFIKT